MMFRGLCFYLSLYLCFPPQIWAFAADHQPVAVPRAVVKVDQRKELRDAFYLASWKLAYLVKGKIPFLIKTHSAEYYSHLEPFQNCPSPFAKEPSTTSMVDDTILLPLQAIFSKFMLEHVADLSEKGQEAESQALESLPLFVSPENKAQCVPSVWRPEKKLVDLEVQGAKGYLAQIQEEARVYHSPFAEVLSAFTGAKMTSMELRAWTGWFMGLRNFRTLLGRYFAARDGGQEVTPAARLSVKPAVGQKFNEVFQSETMTLLKGVRRVDASTASELASLPHFTACDDKKTLWCLNDVKENNASPVDDDILLGMHAPENRSLGLELNGLRKLGIKAWMAQLGLVNSILRKESVPLEGACRAAPDLNELNSFYDRLTKVDQKLIWSGRFSEAVEKLESAYRQGTAETPVPTNAKFYELAQGIASGWLTAYFKRNTFVAVTVKPATQTMKAADNTRAIVAPPGGVAPAEAAKPPAEVPVVNLVEERKKALFDELNAVSFHDRLAEAPGRGSSDFALLIGEKLRLWAELVQEEVSLIPQADRQKAVTGLLEGLIADVFTEALEAYGQGFAFQSSLDLNSMGELWGSDYRTKWQFALKSELLAPTVHEVAEKVSAQLFERLSDSKIEEGQKYADDMLTHYVRTVTPRVKEAAQAEDTVRYLEALRDWKDGPYNLVPGPWNYHWELSKKACVGSSPAFFFVDDGQGHGYGYTLPPPDAMTAEGYLHVTPALRMVSLKQRDALITRLRERGYTDEMVRRMFTTKGARNTGVLADLVLRKFGEALDAKPANDRGASAAERTASLEPLRKWLKQASARGYYDTESQRYAYFLFKRHLRRIFDAQGVTDGALTEELDRLFENNIYLKKPDATALREMVKRWGDLSVASTDSLVATRAELESGQKALQDADAFEGLAAWKKGIADPKSPLNVALESTKAIFLDTKKAKELFTARFQGATESYLLDFLNTFDKSGSRYDTKGIADPLKATLVQTLETGLVEKAWAPLMLDPNQKAKAVGQIRELFLAASTASHDKGLRNAAIVMELSNSILARAEEWFPHWENDLQIQIAKISITVKEPDPKEEEYKRVSQIFGAEIFSLLQFKPVALRERLFQAELAGILLPSFSEFRQAITSRLEIVLAAKANPENELSQTESRRRDLNDRRIQILEKAGTDPAAQKKALETTEGKDLEKELSWLDQRRAQAVANQKARLELRRLVRNYLPDLQEAKNYLNGDTSAKNLESLWASYVSDQFYNSHLDALGKESPLSAGEIIDDLNIVVEGAERKLTFQNQTAKQYLKQIGNYLESASLEKNRPAFARAFEQTLVKEASGALARSGRFSFFGDWNNSSAQSFRTLVQSIQDRVGVTLTPAQAIAWETVVAASVKFPENFRTALLSKLPKGDAYVTAMKAAVYGLATAAEKAELTRDEQKRYWAVVEELTFLSLSPSSELAPVEAASGELVTLAGIPSMEIPLEPVATTVAKPIHPLLVTSSLLRAAQEESLGAGWGDIFAKAKGQNLAATSARKDWVMGLNRTERFAAYLEWQTFLNKAVRKELPNLPLVAREEKVLEFVDWSQTIASHLVLWEKIQKESREQGAIFTKDPRFADLSRAIFRLFVAYLPYRISNGVLVFSAKPGSEEPTLEAYDALSPEKQKDLVDGVDSRVQSEGTRSIQTALIKTGALMDEAKSLGLSAEGVQILAPEKPFETLFLAGEHAPGTTRMIAPDEQVLRLLAKDGVESASAIHEVWSSFVAARLALNESVTVGKTNKFEFETSLPPYKGNPQSARLASWVKSWSESSDAKLSFDLLARETKPSGRPRLWHRHASLEAALASGVVAQTSAILDSVDNLAKYPFIPGTYGYFMASLNWNIFHYGSEPPVGPTAYALAPSESHLAKLMEEVVKAMGLDLRDPNGWQKSLQKYGGPEDWLTIAQSRKNLLVGAGDRRFLGTMVEANYSVNPGLVGANMSYRPFPIVDPAERTQLASSENFNDWWLKTESPALYQNYRTTNSDDRAERPLFEQMASLQGEMLGEKDLHEGNPLRRERFRTQNRSQEKIQFGAVRFDPERITMMERTLELRDAKVAKEDLMHTLQVRESLVDFRRTVSELNLKYNHENFRWAQGRGNDIPDSVVGSAYKGSLEKMLQAYAKQLGSLEPLPELKVTLLKNGKIPDLAGQRRELMARAIFWASQISKNKAYKNRDAAKVKTIFEMADQFYQEEGQKIEVRRGLKTVAAHVNERLKAACEATSVKDITTKEEFLAKKKLLLDDSALVYMDNLQQLMYFDSGWIEDGENSQSRRLLSELSRQASDSKKFASGLQTFVLWSAVITMTVMMLGKSNPGVARTLLGSRAAQVLLSAIGIAAGLSFAGIEAFQVYEDFWGRPDEVALLTSVRDSQFNGMLPVMKDETAALIPQANRQLQNDQRSAWRWSFHVWGAVAGVQALTPVLRWAKGGVRYLVSLKNPLWPVQQRFRTHLKWLGIGRNKAPFEAVAELGETEARSRVLAAYETLLGAVRGPNEGFLIDAQAAKLLHDDAKIQYEELCRQLQINPRTMLPWAEGVAPVASAATPGLAKFGSFWERMKAIGKDFKNAVLRRSTYDPAVWEANALGAAREQSAGRLKFLKDLMVRLNGKGTTVSANDLVALVGIEADPIFRHTPFWMNLFGIPNLGSSVRTLRQLRSVAQADLDVIAMYSDESLGMIAYLSHLSLAGEKTVAKWELFSGGVARKMYKLPAPVRKLFRSLQADAKKLADESVEAIAGQFQTAAEKEIARLKFFRDCFDEALLGVGESRRALLVEKYQSLIDGTLKNFTPAQLGHYKEAYLSELGLAIEPGAKSRIQFVHKMAEWKSRSEAVLSKFCRERGIKEEEAIQWMTNPKNPNYRLFNRPAGMEAPPVEPLDGDGLVALAQMQPPLDLYGSAEELRSLFTKGGWAPDRNLLKALADANYSAMAYYMIRVRHISDPELFLGAERLDRADEPEFVPAESRTANAAVTPRKPLAPVKNPTQLRADIDAGIEKAIQKAVDEAAVNAQKAGIDPARVDVIRGRVEAQAKIKAAEERATLEKAILELERHTGWDYNFRYETMRNRANLSLASMEKYFQREIGMNLVKSPLQEAEAAIAVERTSGIIFDLPQMIKVVQTSKTIPAEVEALVMELLGKQGNTKALERELGVLRRFGKLTPETEQAYKIAIKYHRAMSVAEGMATTAERERLLSWMIDQHLKNTERLIEAEISVTESRELLAIGQHGELPKWEEIQKAAATAKQAGVDFASVDKALETLRLVHPANRDLGDLRTLSLLVDIPAELLPSQIMMEALARSRRSLSALSETNSELHAMLTRRYGAHFEETVDDAFKFLGLPQTATEEVVVARAKQIRTQSESEALRAGNSGDVAAQAIEREVIRRAERAEWLFKNRATPGVRQRVEPKLEMRAPEKFVDVNFNEDALFAKQTEAVDKALVALAREKGFAEIRGALLARMAKGDEAVLKELSAEEKLTRLMHLSIVIADLKASGRPLSQAALDRFTELALENYVNSKALGYSFLPGEAEAFIKESFKNFGNTKGLNFSDPKVLRKLGSIFAEQRALIAEQNALLADQQALLVEQEALLTEGNLDLALEKATLAEKKGLLAKEKTAITEGHLQKLSDALFDLSLRHVGNQLGAAQRLGPEAMTLHSRLGLPEELVMALAAEIEKNPALAKEMESLVQHITYGYKSGFRASDGGNLYGDVKLALYGPNGHALPRGVDAAQKAVMASELELRFILSLKYQNEAQQALVRRALDRLGEGAVPSGEKDVWNELLDGVLRSKFPASDWGGAR